MLNQMKEETVLRWLSSFSVQIKDVFKLICKGRLNTFSHVINLIKE